MMGRQGRPAKHRLLIIFYLLCSVLALTPTIMAPPERQRSLPKGSMETVGGFPRGQPETMQEMENMLARMDIVKKDANFPNDQPEGYPALLKHKISHLLAEAENMLQRVKNLKERRWVGAFIQRIKFLANILDQSVSDNNSEVLEQNFMFEGTMEPDSTTPLIDDVIVSSTPSELQDSAVRETDQKQQGDKMTSKTSKFLPNTDYPASETSVTKPEIQPMFDNESEEYGEDELIKELRNLHKIIALDIFQRNITHQEVEPASVEPSKTPEKATSEVPPKRTSIMALNKLAIEREKSRIKQNLAEQVSELERLGEPEEEILSSLHLNHRFHGSMRPMMFGQKSNPGSLDHGDNGKYFPNVQDVNSNDAMISHIKPRIWRPLVVHPPYNPYKQAYMNNSFQGRYMGLTPVNQQVLARKYQTHMANNPLRTNQQIYQDGIKNTIQKLQKQHQDFLMKNQVPQMQKQAPQNPKQNPSSSLHHPDGKHIYKPYFYNPRNLTAPGPQTMDNPLEPHAMVSHKISSELSDEMKRQLRDGKVILLSDSVVRSNFGPETEKNEGKNANAQEAKKSKNEAQAPK